MADLTISRPDGMGIATLMARNTATHAAINRALGQDAPQGQGISTTPNLTLLGTGPGTWLAVAPRWTPDWIGGLQAALQGLCAVSDQSGAYALFHLAGPDATALLQRGAYIDLDPSAWPARCAVTHIAHIGVIFWQTEAEPGFTIAVFQSMAHSFQHWLDATAATL